MWQVGFSLPHKQASTDSSRVTAIDCTVPIPALTELSKKLGRAEYQGDGHHQRL